MDFEWDENKNRINFSKHGITFEQAAAVFDDRHQLREPGQLAEREIRYQVIGRAEQTSAVLFVAYTLRGSGPRRADGPHHLGAPGLTRRKEPI